MLNLTQNSREGDKKTTKMVSAGGANTWRCGCGHYVTAVSLRYVPIVTSQEKASFFLVNTVLKKN